MDQILGQVLRQAVWERLDMLDEVANTADAQSLVAVVRSELPRLTDAWRSLLAAHEQDHRGRCRECSTRFRPQPAPCAVWRAAHHSLVAVEQESPQARHAIRPARAGRVSIPTATVAAR